MRPPFLIFDDADDLTVAENLAALQREWEWQDVEDGGYRAYDAAGNELRLCVRRRREGALSRFLLTDDPSVQIELLENPVQDSSVQLRDLILQLALRHEWSISPSDPLDQLIAAALALTTERA